MTLIAFSCAQKSEGHPSCASHCGNTSTCIAVGPRVKGAALARLLNVSRQSVHELVERGIVERGADGLIDVERARAAIANNVRPSSKASQALGVHAQEVRAPGSVDSYHTAKARREAAEGSIAELRLAELRGQLVRVDKVRAEQTRLAASIREAILQLPARLAMVLAAEPDTKVVHDLLDAELRQVLALLAGQVSEGAPK